tara:strand:- start:456 stop:914 length:459 start_codon:yes stop_codon:yes gene_type:complete
MKNIIIFIILNLVFFSLSLYSAFRVRNYYYKKRGKKSQTFIEFLNNGKLPTIKNLLIGLIFGMVFGFIDNLGLWLGVDTLQKYMPGGLLSKAALGNTYSDSLGVIVGTSISIMAKESLDYDDDSEPIWLNMVGIVIGCLMGMVAGRAITNKK